MPSQKDPKWEIVDEIPGENQKPQPKAKKSLIKRKSLWLGVGVGIAVVMVFPVLRVILQNLLRAWWLWLGVAVYWYWLRMQRAKRRNR